MRTKESRQYTNDKLSLDAKLVENLKTIGIINSESELSKMMGKNGTYFACMRRRGYGLHLGSLIFLVAKLTKQLNDSENVRERAKLRDAIAAINETIQSKCRIRELELL